ncbi:MAG: T9SS type A sorting domain-containing protein [Burkholderiales bacterium]|nr:T9SS type A sorting domain-containing protein [Bacteroidia bacterium]
MKKIITLSIGILSVYFSKSQNPVSLRSDVSVNFVINVKEKAARVAKDPISNNLFYITSIGNVHEIKYLSTTPKDTLLYTSATHGIDFLQGMVFLDSTLYLIGNKLIDSTDNIGYVKKARLLPSGLRVWSTVAVTDNYAQSFTWYDHGFSGIVVSPDKNYLFISSGSRTDHGEEQNNYGLFPGMREVPLTSAIFRIPINSVNLNLQNYDVSLAPYLYADGTRNSFDLAFDANDNLFATENSGDRDDPDELNWIKQGKHYGFPWLLGGDLNPMQFSGYVPGNDKLLSPTCNCALKGYYYNDPSFPSQGTIVCTPSIKNMGPDADKYREITGLVNDGSNNGNYINSFTPHRSPLGLSFDKTNLLGAGLKGDGFVVSFTRAGDSTGVDIYGYPGTICDPGQDLLDIKLTLNGAGDYEMQATTIVKDFDYPVDTYLDGNILYIIEYSYSGDGRLFKVTLPLDPVGVRKNIETLFYSIYPNPTSGAFSVNFSKENANANICVYDLLGNCLVKKDSQNGLTALFDLSTKPKGVYFVQIVTEDKREVKKIVLE